jgi:hypothetical protein
MPACAGFLTGDGGSSPSSPPRECCHAIDPFFQEDKGTKALCLCHVVNGDAGRRFPAPVNHTRANSFLQQCGWTTLTSEQVSDICANRKS